MSPTQPIPPLAAFAPLCEAIRPRAFMALICARHFGEVEVYRNASGWQVWITGSGPDDPGQRVPLAAWAIRWATRRAITDAS